MASEKELRKKLVKTAEAYLGAKKGSFKHRQIIDVFNEVKPDGWAMTYTAPWCAAFASGCAIEAFGKVKAKRFFPLSANCVTIISKAKDLGIWKESDSYKPEKGDFLLYDWDDSGKGDNKGAPDHVGIVQKATKTKIYVIEGNKGAASEVGVRTVPINGRYIRGFVTPKFDDLARYNAIRLLEEAKSITAEMAEMKFKYKASYKDCSLTWAGAKKKKTTNCSTMVSYCLQESGRLKEGEYFWINGIKIVCKNGLTLAKLKKVATITHPKASPKKAKLQKGDICGYSGNAHTQIFAGWSSNGHPLWYSAGGNADIKKGRAHVKSSYNSKKIETLIRLK